jgi:hypothetical protein
MNTSARSLGLLLAAALVATTAMTPLASAQDWQRHRAPEHVQERQGGHDDTAAWIGLGIAAFAGAALIANAAQPQAVYAPPPAYAQAPAYVQQGYAPAYVQAAPSCTTINGYAACIGPDGNWQYVR